MAAEWAKQAPRDSQRPPRQSLTLHGHALGLPQICYSCVAWFSCGTPTSGCRGYRSSFTCPWNPSLIVTCSAMWVNIPGRPLTIPLQGSSPAQLFSALSFSVHLVFLYSALCYCISRARGTHALQVRRKNTELQSFVKLKILVLEDWIKLLKALRPTHEPSEASQPLNRTLFCSISKISMAVAASSVKTAQPLAH